MYNNILLPIAFMDDRDNGAAINIAKKLRAAGGKITLLHVLEEIPFYAISRMPIGYLDEARLAVQASLKRHAREIGDAEGVLIDGHAGRSILEWAEKNANDCIVLASHHPGLQDYFLGSTAAYVVRHAQCSVHVVR